MASSIQQRIVSACCIILISITVLQYYPPLLACIVSSVAIIEYNDITLHYNSLHNRIQHSIYSIIICINAVYNNIQLLNATLFIILLLTIIQQIHYTTKQPQPNDLHRLCTLLLGHIYVSYSIAHAILLLQPIHNTSYHSSNSNLNIQSPFENNTIYQLNTLIYTIFITGMGENYALLFGSLCQNKQYLSTKLATNVSPNKTIVGCIAQIIGSVITSILCYRYLYNYLPIDYTYNDSIIIGLLLSICGIYGDLHESYIKRCYNIKDSNTLITLPGIGGLLDRIDGLLFNFIAMYYYYVYREFIK